MTPSSSSVILAVDIGATSIKYAEVDAAGRLIGEVGRLDTPYPCPPETLVRAVAALINGSGCERAGVGFPGDMVDGRVLEPGNLSRIGGGDTPFDPQLTQRWTDYDFQSALRERCWAEVRVVNDAALAAQGYSFGRGRELVVTLGTGFGVALTVDGRLHKIRDVGAEDFQGLGTYDEVFGEVGRARDPSAWKQRLMAALNGFVEEFSADLVHAGGGNARHLCAADLKAVPRPVHLNDNEGTLRGAPRLFDEL